MMTYEQVSALHVGDEIINDKYDMARKVVGIKKGHSVILTPKLRGHGKTARVSTTQVAKSHSLPETVLVPEKGKGDVLERVFRKDDVQHMDELFFVVRKLDHFHQKGMIPHCEPRIEAYFQLLETWLEDNDHDA